MKPIHFYHKMEPNLIYKYDGKVVTWPGLWNDRPVTYSPATVQQYFDEGTWVKVPKKKPRDIFKNPRSGDRFTVSGEERVITSVKGGKIIVLDDAGICRNYGCQTPSTFYRTYTETNKATNIRRSGGRSYAK